MQSVPNRMNQSFTRWLFRPYLDLGPVAAQAPHHLCGLEFGYRSLVEDRQHPRIQSALNPSFRNALIQETGLPDYAVTSPLALPEPLRTERWQRLCEFVASFSSLPPRSQVRLTWLIGKLCFQEFLLEMVPESVLDQISQSDDLASLAYLRTYARYRRNLDDQRHPYSLGEFERIARVAPPGIARIDAHYQMVVQNVKHHNNLGAVEYWQPLQLAAIESSRGEIDEFNFLLVMSRFHRVGGFVPQMHRNKEGVVREMDLAEQFARALPRNDDMQRVAADEMLYPVLESRTKEALWLGDLDLAETRARSTVELSPYDARAWLHLGQVRVEREDVEGALQAYLRSARLAPPGREIALFMAGQCHEALDNLEAACDAYLGSLEADPMGIAAAERLEALAGHLGHSPIHRWVRALLETLQARQTVATLPRPEPYKHLPPPVEIAATAPQT